MSKQNLCRICKMRPPWNDKNCPPNVCKRCYHSHVWEDRPDARKQHQAQMALDVLDDLVTDDVLLFDDVADDEALMEWLPGSAFMPPPAFLHNERELHFHIVLQAHDSQRHHDLIQNLERLACTVTTMDEETITGYLLYNPRFSSDRKATAQLHTFLDRWQRKGHLTWSASRKK